MDRTLRTDEDTKIHRGEGTGPRSLGWQIRVRESLNQGPPESLSGVLHLPAGASLEIEL